MGAKEQLIAAGIDIVKYGFNKHGVHIIKGLFGGYLNPEEQSKEKKEEKMQEYADFQEENSEIKQEKEK